LILIKKIGFYVKKVKKILDQNQIADPNPGTPKMQIQSESGSATLPKKDATPDKDPKLPVLSDPDPN